MGLASGLGVTFIRAFMETKSWTPIIVFSIILGFTWSIIWKQTFAKLFEKKDEKGEEEDSGGGK